MSTATATIYPSRVTRLRTTDTVRAHSHLSEYPAREVEVTR